MLTVDHIGCRDLLLTAKTALRQPLKFVLFKVFLESADEAIEPGGLDRLAWSSPIGRCVVPVTPQSAGLRKPRQLSR